MNSDHTPRQRLELFVRSLASADTNPNQAAVLERVDRLDEAGVVTDYSVHVVGREVCPETAKETEPGQFICERVLAFREWAARNGLSIDSFIEPRSVRSQLTGEEYEAIVFPTVVLAAFEGDSLRGVAPCADGETLYTVTDLLDAVEADDGPTYPAGPTPAAERPHRNGGGRSAAGRDRLDGTDGVFAAVEGDGEPALEFELDREEPNLR